MGYVAINVREDDLVHGIFVKGGGYHRGGDFVFHLHEEDYRRGVFVKGFYANGELMPYTWTDGDTDYRASSFPNREDSTIVDLEQYGGTKEQFERHKHEHKLFCERHRLTQGAFVHFPAQ